MRSSPNARRTGGRTKRGSAAAGSTALFRPVGRASLPNPCPNPLAILEAGVRGLSTWVSPLYKATLLGRSPHRLSACRTPPGIPLFMMYYRAFFEPLSERARFSANPPSGAS